MVSNVICEKDETKKITGIYIYVELNMDAGDFRLLQKFFKYLVVKSLEMYFHGIRMLLIKRSVYYFFFVYGTSYLKLSIYWIFLSNNDVFSIAQFR